MNRESTTASTHDHSEISSLLGFVSTNPSGSRRNDDDLPQGAAETHRRIWRIIRNHRGLQNAISQAGVARATGLDVRSVRAVVVELIELYHKAIGSTCDARRGGYFVITNDKDREVATREIRARIAHSAKRLRVLDEISFRKIFKEQGNFFDEPPDAPPLPAAGATEKLFDVFDLYCQSCYRLQQIESDPRTRCAQHK